MDGTRPYHSLAVTTNKSRNCVLYGHSVSPCVSSPKQLNCFKLNLVMAMGKKPRWLRWYSDLIWKCYDTGISSRPL